MISRNSEKIAENRYNISSFKISNANVANEIIFLLFQVNSILIFIKLEQKKLSSAGRWHHRQHRAFFSSHINAFSISLVCG